MAPWGTMLLRACGAPGASARSASAMPAAAGPRQATSARASAATVPACSGRPSASWANRRLEASADRLVDGAVDGGHGQQLGFERDGDLRLGVLQLAQRRAEHAERRVEVSDRAQCAAEVERHPRPPLDCRRGGHRLAQVVDELGAAVGRLGHAELVEQLRPPLGRRRLVHRPAQVVGGRARGAPREGLAGGGAEGLEALLVGGGRQPEQVAGDPLALGPARHEALGRREVQALDLERRDLVVDRRADDGVHEVQGVTDGQDVDADKRVGCRGGRVEAEVAERRRVLERGARTEHREGPRHARGLGREPADAPAQRAAHALRAEVQDLGGLGGAAGMAVAGQFAGEL